MPAFAAFTPFATVGEEGFPKTVRVFGLGVIWVSVGVEFQSVALWFLQRPKGIKTNRIGAPLDLPELWQTKTGDCGVKSTDWPHPSSVHPKGQD